jgi:lambda repressor-like predicted transcriptional regulator
VEAQGVPGRDRDDAGEYERGAVLPDRAARRLVARVIADHDGNLTAASLALRVNRSTLHRLLSRDQLRSDAADRIAVTLGRHPSELWPEWFADEPVSQ